MIFSHFKSHKCKVSILFLTNKDGFFTMKILLPFWIDSPYLMVRMEHFNLVNVLTLSRDKVWKFAETSYNFYKPFIVFDLVLAYIWIFFTLSPSLCRPQTLGSHLPILTKLVSLERSWPVEWPSDIFWSQLGLWAAPV
jgi:hypothetical protein